MILTRDVLAVVLALLSAAGAQTRGTGGTRPSVGRGARPRAAFEGAKVAGSLSTRSLPVPTPTSCPVVSVSCPDLLKPGAPMTFAANVAGGDPNVTPTFNWQVSGGRIVSGRRTSAIRVDASRATSQPLTATVDVVGYDPACTISASCTMFIEPPIMPRKFDEYGVLRFEEEKARLDAFAAELRKDPTSQGYLICYGGRRAGAGEARRRCGHAAKYLADSLREDSPSRVVAVEGGCREVPTVESWVVPAGAVEPRPAPTCAFGKPRRAHPARRARRSR